MLKDQLTQKDEEINQCNATNANSASTSTMLYGVNISSSLVISSLLIIAIVFIVLFIKNKK
jgi:hypothetical protein